MKLFKTPNCLEYVSDIPEQIPDYLYFKKYNKSKMLQKQQLSSFNQSHSKFKIEKLNFQLNTQIFKAPDQKKLNQLNKKINNFYQQFRDDRMKETIYPNKICTFKKNINFNKGTLSLSFDETRLQLKKNAQMYAEDKIQKDMQNKQIQSQIQAQRNIVTEKILTNFRDSILLVYENIHVFENLCKTYKYLNKDQFFSILKVLGVKNENNFYEKVFWIFDINSNQMIELSDIKYGSQKFTEYKIENQVKIFFDLCDLNKEGFINQQKIFYFLQANLKKMEDKSILFENVKEIMGMIKCKNINQIQKKELKESCLIHKALWDLIQQNISSSKIKKTAFKQEIKLIDQMNQNYSLTIPYFEKVIHYIKGNEEFYENYMNLKQDFFKRTIINKNLFIN